MNSGVKQGCILSPLLFNIFLSDLLTSLGNTSSAPVQLDSVKSINSIIWADDLILLPDTENGLDALLGSLKIYTDDNLLEVNLDKTKCMIFNKTGRMIRRNVWFGNKKVEMIREYKYLGFLLTPSLNLLTALNDLKDRWLRTYGAIKTKLGIL